MINKIGEKIKYLRKKSNMTQEILADYLGITFQAVSRWESGICYPDLELLPSIANIFNVTTDELLGVDITKKQAIIEQYENESIVAGQKGDIESAIMSWRKALHEFPNDYYIMNNLALSLHFYYLDEVDINLKNIYYDEALTLGEKILEECTDDKIRYDAIRLLVQIYKYKGDEKHAKMLIDNMPDIYSCSNMLLTHILENDELIEHERNNIDLFMFFLKPAILKVSEDKKYSVSDKINIYKLYETLLDIIYGEDSEEIKKREYKIYLIIAKYYGELDDIDNTLKYLEKLKYYSVENVKVPIYDNYEMKSILFKGQIRQDEYIKNYDCNSAMLALNEINATYQFNFISNTDRFQSVLTELEKYAKEQL